VPLSKGLLSGYVRLSAESKVVLLNQMSSMPSLQQMMTNWTGEMSWVYSGTDTIKNQIITYEYDDDFNEIEVKKTQNKAFYRINGLVEMNTTEGSAAVLTDLGTEGVLLKKGKGYTTVFLTDETKVFSRGDKIVIESFNAPKDVEIKNTQLYLYMDNRENNLIDHIRLPNIHLQRFKPLSQYVEELTVQSSGGSSVVLVIRFKQLVIPTLQHLLTKSSRI